MTSRSLFPGVLRQTITHLSVHSTSTTQINQIILCDCIHKTDNNDATKCWNELKTVNFSSNCIQSIDSSVTLLPKLKTFILDRNRITTISNLNQLPYLSSLSLCENLITECIDCHLELGNLKTLKLSQNRLTSLIGFRKMYSLVTLDVSCNLIADIDEVDNVAGLPCLEELVLTANPVAGIVGEYSLPCSVPNRFYVRILSRRLSTTSTVEVRRSVYGIVFGQRKGRRFRNRYGFGVGCFTAIRGWASVATNQFCE